MTGRLDHVIRNLQDVVRIKQEDRELISTTIESVLHQAKQTLSNSACYISFETPEGESGLIVTDQKLLTMALERVLTNAVMFGHPERDPEIVVWYSKGNSKYHQLTVSDNGIGIAEEQMNKIFKMFFRGSVLSTGSGLGLYLAHSAITKPGGTIQASTVAGEGSVFTIRWMNHEN